jgi:hypothetical protein
MNFIFENLDELRNVVSCNDVNSSNILRFPTSPLVSVLLRWNAHRPYSTEFNVDKLTIDSFKNRKLYDNYIIPTGVAHSPWDWCGYTDIEKQPDSLMAERKTIFSFLDDKQLSALRKKQCFLLLDQSHEGYHTDWLFEWFHTCCTQYDISPSRIIYVTGNLAAAQQYKEWCADNQLVDVMCVIPYAHFEEFIYDCANTQSKILPTSDQQIAYKVENANSIKLYNAFQKRPRPHRIWLFNKLYEHGLIDDGINSMNAFGCQNGYYDGKFPDVELYNSYRHLLPMYPRINLEDNKKIGFEGPLGDLFEQDLNHQATLDTWISVISEASFAENTCFISEKTFKPIANRHPFIMYGNKHSLRYLRELGYKTFDGFIDESYDTLDSWDRLDAIIKVLKDIRAMPVDKKITWFSSMQDILDHNFKILKDNSTVNIPNAMITLRDYVKGTTHVR